MKKIWIIVWIPLLLILPISFAKNLYTGFNFTVGILTEDAPNGIAFNGSHFYITGIGTDQVFQYNASGNYTGVVFSVGSEENTPNGIAFNGSHFYIVGSGSDRVYEYKWNISGVFFNFSVVTQDNSAQGIAFNGSHFYVVGQDADSVYEYNKSGVFTEFNFSVTSEDISPTGIVFMGKHFYVVGTGTDSVYEYNLSGKFTGFNFSVKAQETDPRDLAFNGSHFYVVGQATDSVYGYTYFLNYQQHSYPISNVLETSSQSFSIEYTNLSGLIDMNSILVYNGTSYNPNIKTLYPTKAVFNYTLYIPKIKSSDLSYNNYFYFDYNFTFNDKNGSETTDEYTQNVSKITLTNCTSESASTMNTLHHILKEETNEINQTGDISVSYNIWNENPSLYRNYSFTVNSTDYMNICIYPNWSAYYTDAIYEYTAPNYRIRNYFLTNVSLTNISQNIYLYLANTSTDLILIYVKDENDNPVTDADIYIKRYYPDTNSYNTVEITRTDLNGGAIAHLMLYNVFYAFLVKKDNNVLKESSKAKVYLTTLTIQVNLQPSYLSRYTNIDGINYNLVYDNTTRQATFTYLDNSGVVKKGCLRVFKRDLTETTLIDECVESTSSTITYTLPSGNWSGSYFIEGYAYTASVPGRKLLDSIEVVLVEDWRKFGATGVFLALFFVAEIALLMSISPALSVIASVLSFASFVLMGMVGLSYSATIVLIILGIMVYFKVRQ